MRGNPAVQEMMEDPEVREAVEKARAEGPAGMASLMTSPVGQRLMAAMSGAAMEAGGSS